MNSEITMEPVGSEIVKEPCFAMIQEEATGRVLWSDGPFEDGAHAQKAAERQVLILKVKEQSI